MIIIRHMPLEEIAAHQGAIFEIGSESCCIKFCYEIQQFTEHSQICSGKIFRLVTPRVPQEHMEAVIKTILIALHTLNITKVIINDYGLLYELRKAGVSKEFVFGRLLVRSQEWEHNYRKRVHPDENSDILASWLYPSVLHKKKIELLRKMNVTGVELCPSNAVKEMLLHVNEFNMDAYVHYNSFVGAVGRACPCLKKEGIHKINCWKCCDNIHQLKLFKMYGNFDEPTAEELSNFSRNYQIGNIIYFKNEAELFPYDRCDGVIIDARINDVETVSDIISNIAVRESNEA